MAARLSMVLALALLSLAASALAKEFVLTLDAKNFDEEVKKADFIVVEFYAPWCGHCKQLAPEYEKAAKALTEAGLPVVLAKVDADNGSNKPLAQKYGVQGFPTLKIFRKGDLENAQDYKGPREADGIVSFLKKQAGPASSEVTTGAEITGLLKDEPVVVVGVFPAADSAEQAAFMAVADDLRSDFIFRHTSDASLLPLEHPKLEKTPAVRVLMTFDEGHADTTDFDAESLKKFISSKSLPVVIEFSQDPKDRPFLSRAFESSDKKCLLFYSYNLSNAAEWRAKYTEVAKTRPEGITFIAGEDSQNEHALKYFGIDQSETPAIIIHDPKTNSKYFRTKIELAAIADFVEKFVAGKEEKKMKSEPIPEKNDGSVTVVVGRTFQELVLDTKKNVLIEFYAPWCGHCKKLEPIYKQVGDAFKKDADVVIAKLDYTANDLPGEGEFEVQGFPTLYFYTSTKQVIPYKGDRSKKDLINFVKEQMERVKSAQSNSSQVDEEEAAEEAEAAADAESGDGAQAKDEL